MRVAVRTQRHSGTERPHTAALTCKREHLKLSGKESFLVLAPHCDDETLGAGALLAEAVEKGCRVKVVFMTNGDGSLYAVRRHFKRLPLSPARQIEFAYLRQDEAKRALSDLGVLPKQVVFLGYPDRGLQFMWKEAWDETQCYRSRSTGARASPYTNSLTPGAPYCGRAVVDDLRQLLLSQRPTHVVAPHPRDAHSDHWAAFYLAIQALEELRQEGFPLSPRILTYLVHHRTWPTPRGLHPYLELRPPASFPGPMDAWIEFRPSPMAITAKHAAILRYRSQLSLQARFLLSFVRKNEIFGLYAPMQVPCTDSGVVLIDGSASEWPPGVGLMEGPRRNTARRRNKGGADVSVIAVCADGGYLYMRFRMQATVTNDVSCTVRLATCQRERRQIDLRLVAPNQAFVRSEGRWVCAKDVVCRTRGRVIELAVPRAMCANSERIVVGVETRDRQLLVDRTAWELLVLPPLNQEASCVYTTASRDDLSEVATILGKLMYPQSFEPPQPVLLSLLEMLYDAEPQGFLIAKGPGGIIGYVISTQSLRTVWYTAFAQGHIWRWFVNWLRGRYKVSLRTIVGLSLEKYCFIFRSFLHGDRLRYRILSIGVVPEERRRGVATCLMHHALERFWRLGAQSVHLEVRSDNEAAMYLYEKLGFSVSSSMRGIRGGWWVMEKTRHGSSNYAQTVG